MGAAVVLLHRLADGSWHYDWMIQRDEEVGAGLVTFRVGERIDRAGVGEFRAQRIGEHRAEYLSYEGDVPDGRGNVERVAEGFLEIEKDGGGEFVCVGRLGEVRGRWEGKEGSAGWAFVVR